MLRIPLPSSSVMSRLIVRYKLPCRGNDASSCSMSNKGDIYLSYQDWQNKLVSLTVNRFRKSNNTGSPNKVDIVPKPETSKRESYPAVFKFNEGFTNAIKWPVRMREFLP
ncbi:hypothetical protein MLD38_039500 [Melastoma candidum]|uniref:Uncharacterized protein n=1 Tax=Melastoma candidum TaxID=119954 RepID=A0ACB9L3I3_9MYRT|nr:hypothetical protein MLD38_039500 [Melastoma candidum]